MKRKSKRGIRLILSRADGPEQAASYETSLCFATVPNAARKSACATSLSKMGLFFGNIFPAMAIKNGEVSSRREWHSTCLMNGLISATKKRGTTMQSTDFRDSLLLKELRELQTFESDLDRQFALLQKAEKPAPASQMRFLAQLTKLQFRVESLNQMLDAS